MAWVRIPPLPINFFFWFLTQSVLTLTRDSKANSIFFHIILLTQIFKRSCHHTFTSVLEYFSFCKKKTSSFLTSVKKYYPSFLLKCSFLFLSVILNRVRSKPKTRQTRVERRVVATFTRAQGRRSRGGFLRENSPRPPTNSRPRALAPCG